MAAAAKSSQDIIDEFWKTSISTENLTKASTVLPPNVYSQLVGRQVPRGATAAEPVEASYEIAKKDCEKKVAQIVKECMMVNQKYSDPYFDLELRTDCIYPLFAIPSSSDDEQPGKSYDITQDGGAAGKLIIFGEADPPTLNPPSVKRIGDIFDHPEFFVDGANAKDIRQGRDGDCWALSALSTLCNLEPTQQLINRVCVARDQDVGVYGFVFYRDGEWTSVVIDDKLYLREPEYEFTDIKTRQTWEEHRIRVNSAEEYRKEFQSNSRSLYYAQSADPNETWVPLIEKAFAKAHGDYGAVNSGSVGEGVEDFTGGISTTIIPTDILSKDKFWNEGLLKVNKEFLFGCGTTRWDKAEANVRDGIHGNHAYSILRAVNYGKERLVLIRNPWGEQEWNGPWSDGSREWNSESIKALGHTFGNDGIFWIRYEDVLRKYNVIWRTRLFTPEWKVTQQWISLAIPWAGDYQDTKFEITIAKATETVIVLSKLNDRYFRGLMGQYTFVISFRVHRAGEEDYIMRTFGGEQWDRSVSCELPLEPGTYEVRVKITAIRDEKEDKIEDVVRTNWLVRREKLLQIGKSYDLAHAKAQVQEEKKPKEAASAPDIKPAPPTTETTATSSAAVAVPTTADFEKPTPKGATANAPNYGDGGIEATGAEETFYADSVASGPDADTAEPADAKNEPEEDKPDAPWSAVAVVGLRVYCRDADATIRIVRPKVAEVAVEDAKLDVDDPARDAAKGEKAKDEEKEAEGRKVEDAKVEKVVKEEEKTEEEKKEEEKTEEGKKEVIPEV